MYWNEQPILMQKKINFIKDNSKISILWTDKLCKALFYHLFKTNTDTSLLILGTLGQASKGTYI